MKTRNSVKDCLLLLESDSKNLKEKLADIEKNFLDAQQLDAQQDANLATILKSVRAHVYELNQALVFDKSEVFNFSRLILLAKPLEQILKKLNNPLPPWNCIKQLKKLNDGMQLLISSDKRVATWVNQNKKAYVGEAIKIAVNKIYKANFKGLKDLLQKKELNKKESDIFQKEMADFYCFYERLYWYPPYDFSSFLTPEIFTRLKKIKDSILNKAENSDYQLGFNCFCRFLFDIHASQAAASMDYHGKIVSAILAELKSKSFNPDLMPQVQQAILQLQEQSENIKLALYYHRIAVKSLNHLAVKAQFHRTQQILQTLQFEIERGCHPDNIPIQNFSTFFSFLKRKIARMLSWQTQAEKMACRLNRDLTNQFNLNKINQSLYAYWNSPAFTCDSIIPLDKLTYPLSPLETQPNKQDEKEEVKAEKDKKTNVYSSPSHSFDEIFKIDEELKPAVTPPVIPTVTQLETRYDIKSSTSTLTPSRNEAPWPVSKVTQFRIEPSSRFLHEMLNQKEKEKEKLKP